VWGGGGVDWVVDGPKKIKSNQTKKRRKQLGLCLSKKVKDLKGKRGKNKGRETHTNKRTRARDRRRRGVALNQKMGTKPRDTRPEEKNVGPLRTT